MIKQVQSVGERDWFADHILTPQNELWKVLEKWLGQYDQPCILSGCVVSANGGNFDVTAGILLLKDVDGNYQYCEFAGANNVALPQYIKVVETDTNALYYDSNIKPIAKAFTATMQPTLPVSGYWLQFTATNTPKWQDVIQDAKHRLVSDTQINLWTNSVSVYPGMIVAWPGNAIPAGWLECDGSAVSRTTEAGIFAVIGTTYGAGDGSTTFNLPDIRGEFIRGLDRGRGIDTGRVIGTTQADAIKATIVKLPIRKSNNNYGTGSQNGPIIDITDLTQNEEITFGAATNTHPQNVAMPWIIKH